MHLLYEPEISEELKLAGCRRLDQQASILIMDSGQASGIAILIVANRDQLREDVLEVII